MVNITLHHIKCEADFEADYDERDVKGRRLVYLTCPKCKTEIKMIMKKDSEETKQ